MSWRFCYGGEWTTIKLAGDKDDIKEDDDDVQWQTDTSAATARQHIHENNIIVTTDMVMLSAEKEPVKKVRKHVAEENSKFTYDNGWLML